VAEEFANGRTGKLRLLDLTEFLYIIAGVPRRGLRRTPGIIDTAPDSVHSQSGAGKEVRWKEGFGMDREAVRLILST
jgi:hypothetical protein